MAFPDPLPLAGLDALSRAYGLGAIRSCRYLPDGLLNRNWRIDTAQGVFALKELVGLDPDVARRNLALLQDLSTFGVPVVEAVPARSGETVIALGGHHYYLAPWIEGAHPRGEAMDADAAFHMGSVIGRIHRALGDPAIGLPAPQPPGGAPTTPDEARERIGDYLGRIGLLAAPSEFDTACAKVLRARLELLAAHEHLRPADTAPTGPFGWMHGDCQNWNLLWSGGRIAAVIDWDRLCVKPFGEEIVRAAMYQFVLADGRVDLGNVAALVAGYRSEAPIDAAALVDAARRRWWRLTSSVWHLKYHYHLGDHSSDHLFFSDERLVRWWTAHLDEVEAAFAA
ncbi:phosphotransferase [Glycomyces harbinensis]|uniref:Ser/Thr protein kinase RdoA involved in Cpx stress response, MazF antagonist n=1 Tax=Glycomyces harbinensis TaxID=58114 RepID=A0A1G6VWR1_9ACTN|nr:phosphotransferase [Glycomyces harbinensis]SDD58029.1 Ser/Thr protein kinase RdoA involved in Cpx stress response, MazF antagonist [Glycomyces harbinensis]